MYIIGLIGKGKSGKSTAAEMITAQHLVFRGGAWSPVRTTQDPIEGRAIELALADPMKVFCSEVYGWSDWILWGPSEAREVGSPEYGAPCAFCAGLGEDKFGQDCAHCTGTGRTLLTARHALQQLGTEWGRRMHEDTWVRLLLRRALELVQIPRTRQLQVSHGTASHVVETCSLIVVSDVRYQNEVDAIRAAGGVIWEISRATGGLTGAAALHTSEAGGLTPDLVVHNNGALEELRAALRVLVRAYLARGSERASPAGDGPSAPPAMPF